MTFSFVVVVKEKRRTEIVFLAYPGSGWERLFSGGGREGSLRDVHDN